MAVTNRLFTYSATPISGASQSGNLIISNNYIDGYTWWGGPDENLGYVIAHTDTNVGGVRTERNGASTISGNTVGFWRSSTQSDASFLSMVNGLFDQSYLTASTAANWLNSNGYWTSWTSLISAIKSFNTRVLDDLGVFESESCLNTQLTQLDNQNILDSAYLIVTPNGYKEGILYSVSPSNASVDMTVTRSTRATRVNEDGLIENVPYNIFTRSEEFDNSTWVKQRTSILTNNIISPNGTLTGENLVANNGVTYLYIGASGVNIVSNSIVQSTTIQTISFYLKYNGLNRIRVMYGGATTMIGNIYVEVDLQSGVITSTNYGAVASNGFIEDAGNGWYRVGFTTILSLSTTNNRFGVGLGDSTKTIANGVDGVYVWGAQLVLGTQPKTYLPVSTGFNFPRLDYTNSSCPSILVEPQRTNLLLYSEDFSNGWSVESTSFEHNNVTSPSGFQNASTLSETNTNDVHRTYRAAVATTSSALYTYSFFVKKDTIRYVRLVINQSNDETIWTGAQFDLDTQTFISATGTGGVFNSASITSYANNWYRLSITGSIPGTLTFFLLVLSNIGTFDSTDSRGSATYTGNINNKLQIWGAQVELGANTTSYIVTTTSTVTRNLDLITSGLLNNNTTSYSIFFDISYSADFATQSGDISANPLTWYFRRLNSTSVNFWNQNGQQNLGTFTFSPANSVKRFKGCLVFNGSTISTFINGVKIGNQITPTSLTPYTTFLNSNTNRIQTSKVNLIGGFDASHQTKLIGIIPTNLTDEKAITLTTL